MDREEARERIEKLKKLINYYRYLYHVENREEISPEALDSLKHELYLLEQKFPEFVTPDSPTQRVEGKPLAGFKKVVHQFPMLSMEDVFSFQELKEWEEYLKKFLPEKEFEYVAELKVDGFAVTLIYENGIFKLGATRGTGKVGEDVTVNLKTIETIPLRLEIYKEIKEKEIEKKLKALIQKGRIEIRGEVYIDKKDFEKLNEELAKKGEKTFSNPRNLASGSIRQLDPKLAASRPLKFIAYDIVTDLGQKKHSQEHEILESLGFKVPQWVVGNLEKVYQFWKEMSEKREKIPFLIDGIVVLVNDNQLFEKLGVVGKSPRGIRAFKFSPKEATTILEDVVFQVGRTGAVTPVAILKPVEVGGVTISRATLHNFDEIKRLGVKIGDTVVVGRSGDVIPQILKTLPELRTGKEKNIVFPQNCPVCSTKLVKKEGEVIFRCPNVNCPAKQKEYFLHFVSKNAFDIVGLSEKTIERLVDFGLIQDPADLFLLKEGDLIPLERFGEKSAKNLISSIQSRKEIPLANFIYALGIRHCGIETAHLLANHFQSLERLMKASLSELQSIKDIGPVVAHSIYSFFREKRNLDFIEKLKKVGVKIISPQKPKEQPLKGKIFVFTGTLESFTREEAKNKVRELGGEVSDSVSKRTTFLVVGSQAGSKLEKAKKLGVKIIDEKEFLKMIGK
jgi:DNA ligase (NAD+)